MLRWPWQGLLPRPRGAVLPGRGGGGGNRMVLKYAAEVGWVGGGVGGLWGLQGPGAFKRDLCCSLWGEGEPPLGVAYFIFNHCR